MTRLDELAESIIAATKRARTPDPAGEGRVRARTLSAIAAGVTVPDVAPSLVEGLSDVVHDVAESLGEGATQARVVLGVAALSDMGVGGYALGFEAGHTTARVASPVKVVKREVVVTREGPSRAVAPPVTPTAPAEVPSRAPPARGRAGAELGNRTTTPALDPDEELRALRRIERVLREQNPRLALGLLSELDQAVPRGRFQEEREAARTVAKCALDAATSTANAHAADYLARYPGSVYSSRVQQACAVDAPGERKPRSAETDPDK